MERTNAEVCADRNIKGWFCSLEPSHFGPHRAYAMHDRENPAGILEAWPNDKNTPFEIDPALLDLEKELREISKVDFPGTPNLGLEL